jgi:Ca2+/H+ antiporter, TMEM165/GDT1 family
MSGIGIVLLTTFLASSVEAIEMVTIVIGVGVTRGWRSSLLGAVAGFAVLAVIVAILGAALAAIPIGPLRLFVGALLLLFGLQWYRKGIVRVAARGLSGIQAGEVNDDEVPSAGIDWTAFVLSFKGVLLEGLEVALIVVSFGATAGQPGPAIVAGAAAIVVVGAIGLAINPVVSRIPRSLLQLIVGTLLTSFGTFWALEGLGVSWPQSDVDIALLLAFYGMAAAAFIALEQRARRLALQPVTS